MSEKKISAGLKDYLQQNRNQAHVEVVLELTPLPDDTGAQYATRSAKMASYQQAFAQSLEPVKDLILRQGGDVLDAAWLNQTVKVKLPVDSLSQLAQLSQVTAIDLPHPLSAD